jgi:transposase
MSRRRAAAQFGVGISTVINLRARSPLKLSTRQSASCSKASRRGMRQLLRKRRIRAGLVSSRYSPIHHRGTQQER